MSEPMPAGGGTAVPNEGARAAPLPGGTTPSFTFTRQLVVPAAAPEAAFLMPEAECETLIERLQHCKRRTPWMMAVGSILAGGALSALVSVLGLPAGTENRVELLWWTGTLVMGLGAVAFVTAGVLRERDNYRLIEVAEHDLTRRLEANRRARGNP